MSKNKVWLTEYPLWKAAHGCIDMSQEENRNIKQDWLQRVMHNDQGMISLILSHRLFDSKQYEQYSLLSLSKG